MTEDSKPFPWPMRRAHGSVETDRTTLFIQADWNADDVTIEVSFSDDESPKRVYRTAHVTRTDIEAAMRVLKMIFAEDEE